MASATEARSQIKKYARLAVLQGWDIGTGDASRHEKWRSPAGACVTVPSSPSDWRSVLNTRAELRRAGLNIPPKGYTAPKGKRDLSA